MFSWKALFYSFLIGALTSIIAPSIVEWYGYSNSVWTIAILILLVKYSRLVLLALKKCLDAGQAFFRWTGAATASFFHWSGSKLSLLNKTSFMRGAERVFIALLEGTCILIAGVGKLIFSPPVLLFMVLYVSGYLVEKNNKRYPGYNTAVAAPAENCYCPPAANTVYRSSTIQPARRQPSVLPDDCDRPRAGYGGSSAAYTYNETPVLYSPAPKGRKNRRARAYSAVESSLIFSPTPYEVTRFSYAAPPLR